MDPQESDHRASYPSYRGLQLQGQLKTNFCKIFRTAQFSTFSTASVKTDADITFVTDIILATDELLKTPLSTRVVLTWPRLDTFRLPYA
jgi:hypothetical protein